MANGNDMPKQCVYCLKRPKRMTTNKLTKKPERDQWCSAKCKRADMNDYYKYIARDRPCDPDHGWF